MQIRIKVVNDERENATKTTIHCADVTLDGPHQIVVLLHQAIRDWVEKQPGMRIS